MVDLCCYWFRRAHDRLGPGGRAGLVGTSGIRIGKARAASLDYLVENGGTITNAVSSRAWPGEAALNVSMVNWIKASADGIGAPLAPPPHTLVVDDYAYALDRIPTHLQLYADLTAVRPVAANESGTSIGVQFGSDAFRASGEGGFAFGPQDLPDPSILRPVAAGDDLLRGKLCGPDSCIWLVGCESEGAAEAVGGAAFAHLKRTILPLVRERAAAESGVSHYGRWLQVWWKPHWAREEFFDTVRHSRRMIVCSNPQARPIFAFISTKFVPTNTMQLFAFDDDYSFGIIQSRLHWEWTKAKGGRVTDRIRYTGEVWSTFPWPQAPTEAEVVAVAEAARKLRKVRDTLMKDNGWSLRALYQAAEVAGPHPLKDAQAALDDAVRAAYQMPADQEATEFLLELNKLVAEDEAAGHAVKGPGLPPGLDPRDPRFTSDDCIEPPRS